MTVDVRLSRRGAPVMASTVRLVPGAQVLVGGPAIPAGRLILILGAR